MYDVASSDVCLIEPHEGCIKYDAVEWFGMSFGV